MLDARPCGLHPGPVCDDGEYFLTDKRAMASIDRFARRPADCVSGMDRLLSHPGDTPAMLTGTVRGAQAVWRDIVAFTGSAYQPKYHI